MVGSPPGASDGSDQAGDPPTIDQVLAALGHHLRREVVAYLSDGADQAVTLESLVDHVARQVGAEEGQSREQLAIRLHHHHLPRLADAGILEFEHRTGRVRYHGDEDIEMWLARMQSWEPD